MVREEVVYALALTLLFGATLGVSARDDPGDIAVFRYREYRAGEPAGREVPHGAAIACQQEYGARIPAKYAEFRQRQGFSATTVGPFLVYGQEYLDEAEGMARCLGLKGGIYHVRVDFGTASDYRVFEAEPCGPWSCSSWNPEVHRA